MMAWIYSKTALRVRRSSQTGRGVDDRGDEVMRLNIGCTSGARAGEVGEDLGVEPDLVGWLPPAGFYGVSAEDADSRPQTAERPPPALPVAAVLRVQGAVFTGS
jgi:hypothetical protein